MRADVIDMEKWQFDRLARLTDAALRAMSSEQLERLMRDLERHVKETANT